MHQLERARRVRLARNARPLAQRQLHEITEIVAHEGLCSEVVLVRHDADRDALLAQLFQHIDDAVIRLRAVHHALVVCRAEIVEAFVDHRFGALFLGDAALHQTAHAVAYALPRQLLVYGRKAARNDSAVDAVAQVAQCVEQRAVQIKNRSFHLHCLCCPLPVCVRGMRYPRI